MFTGLKFYENIQIMTPFLNLDQLFQISFLHIPFFSLFLFLISSSTFHLRCWFQWYYCLLAISSRISKPQTGLWVGLSSQNFHRLLFFLIQTLWATKKKKEKEKNKWDLSPVEENLREKPGMLNITSYYLLIGQIGQNPKIK